MLSHPTAHKAWGCGSRKTFIMSNEIQNTGHDNMVAIIQSAPDALLLNQSQVEKAEAAITATLAKIEQFGMSDELDALCNKQQVRMKELLSEIKDRRMPLTRMFDEVKSRFTELEGKLDPQKSGSLYYQVQVKRNAWATEKAMAQKKREEEAALKLKQDQERVTLKTEAEIQLRNGFIGQLAFAKQSMQAAFDSTTLETIEGLRDTLIGWTDIYNIGEFNAINIALRSAVLNAKDIELIITNARIGKFDNFCAEYRNEITILRDELLIKISGKKAELEAMAEAKRQAEAAAKAAAAAKDAAAKAAAEEAQRKAAEEQARLEQQRKDREEREAREAEAARIESERKAKEEAEARKQVEMTNTLFDNTAELAQATEQANAVESFDIEVTNPAGWMLIFQLWFKNEGSKLANADMEKKTMKQMKTFCEKHAKKTDEQIESPFIVYKPVYKVRAEK